MANGIGGASGALSGAAAGTAIAPGIGTVIGGLGGLLAGLFGGQNNDAANAAYQNAIDAYNKLGTPPDLSNPLVLQGFKQAGALTPELLQNLNLNADKQQTLNENPQNRQQQEYALNALKDLSQTGLTATDRAAFNQLRNQTAADTQAKTNQLLQQQQMRGQGSAGSTLAAQLSAAQAAGQNASSQADQMAAQAQNARTSALGNFANLAGQVRSSDLGTQEYNMNNELQRQRFLDQNSLARQQANVAAQNAANQYNLGRQQSTSDANTAMQNQELQRQVQAQQQQYMDALAQAQGIAGTYEKQGAALSGQAANQAANNGNMLTAGLGAVQSLGTPNSQGQTPWSQIFGGGTVNNNAGSAPSNSGNSSSTSQYGGLGGNYQFSHGGVVPGKPKVFGDNEINDTVPAKLSPGEIVIPRSFAHDPDLSKAYINFIHKHKEKIEDAKNAHEEHTRNMCGGGMMEGYAHGGNVLDANARAHIAPHNFALPGGRYPIEDISHARNALARVSQHGSPEEQAKVRAAVHHKYPSIGMADGGVVPGGEFQKNAQDFQKGFNGGEDVNQSIRNLLSGLGIIQDQPQQNMAFGGMVPNLGIHQGKMPYAGESDLSQNKPIINTSEKIMPRNPSLRKPKSGHEILGSLSNFLKDIHEMKK